MKISGLVVVVLALAGATLSAQTYKIIYNFTNYSGGLQPKAGLTFNNGILYGATSYNSSGGSIFKINPDGSGYSLLNGPGDPHGFSAGLTLNGNTIYGANGSSIFKTYTDATGYVNLRSLIGYNPLSDFVLSGTNLFATSNRGGSTGLGMIFSVNTDGTMSAGLHSFTNTPDGASPLAGLVLGGNTLYGTTSSGGSAGFGTVFEINTDGTGYTILYNFTNTSDGTGPQGDLVLNGSTLFGITRNGGNAGFGTVFAINTDGTGYTVLHNFTGRPDGANPQAGLLLRGNMLYGTTYNGGSSDYGTVFGINTNGSGYAIIRSFLGYYYGDGANPSAGLVAGSDGLYGTTTFGGTNNSSGTIFKLTLPPPALQVASAGGAPVVFWQNDGFQRTVQTTTNLKSGKWTTVSNGLPLVGLQITNAASQPQAFFRLQ